MSFTRSFSETISPHDPRWRWRDCQKTCFLRSNVLQGASLQFRKQWSYADRIPAWRIRQSQQPGLWRYDFIVLGKTASKRRIFTSWQIKMLHLVCWHKSRYNCPISQVRPGTVNIDFLDARCGASIRQLLESKLCIVKQSRITWPQWSPSTASRRVSWSQSAVQPTKTILNLADE
jgi:hypothetical protein